MQQWLGGSGEVLRKSKMLRHHLSITFVVVGWRSSENCFGHAEAVQKVIELLDRASSKHIVLLEDDEAVSDMTIGIFQVLNC
jgi:hypothetical protein